jgi:hypothetical protein
MRSAALLAGFLMLVCCAPAQAAPKTVAKRGAFTLHAESRKDGELCITLRRARRYQGMACGRVPRSPQRPLRMFPDVGFDNYAVVVPPSVRTAEVETRDGRRARHRTFAAPGFSARFVLIPAPPVAKFVRYYGADGSLLGIEGGPDGYIQPADTTAVYGEHFEGVEASTEPLLMPTPDQADRLRTLACVTVANDSGGRGLCDQDSESALVVMGSCDGPDLIGGIAGAGVASVRLTLGSGAEWTIAASELPAAFGGRRAFGGPVPSGEAVRSAVALDATGQAIASTVVGMPPGGQPCAGTDQGDDRFGEPFAPLTPPQGAVTVATAAGESLLVADQGETLCVALGELGAGNCPLPPVDSDEPALLRRGGSVAGALSRDADRITLQLDRGKDVTVRTTDGAAYTGRWAGKVRFFAAPVAASRNVTGAIVRDAAGTIIGISTTGIARQRVNRRVLAERAGQGVEFTRRAGEQPCLTAFAADLTPAPSFCTVRNPGTPIDGPNPQYSGAVVVACAPRQAIAYGRLPDGEPAPEVVLAGDRTVRSRKVSLPDRDAWVAILPDAAVRGLRAGDRRVALRLPPASAQCGYSLRRAF